MDHFSIIMYKSLWGGGCSVNLVGSYLLSKFKVCLFFCIVVVGESPGKKQGTGQFPCMPCKLPRAKIC